LAIEGQNLRHSEAADDGIAERLANLTHLFRSLLGLGLPAETFVYPPLLSGAVALTAIVIRG